MACLEPSFVVDVSSLMAQCKKSLKTIQLFLIFQTCFDGTSVIVSVTVKITSVGYIILRSQVFVHNITMHAVLKVSTVK